MRQRNVRDREIGFDDGVSFFFFFWVGERVVFFSREECGGCYLCQRGIFIWYGDCRVQTRYKDI